MDYGLATIIMLFTTNVTTFFCFIAMSFFVLLYRSRAQKFRAEMKKKDKLIAQLSISINELEETVSKRKIVGTFKSYEQ